jgi:hypothetical protein
MEPNRKPPGAGAPLIQPGTKNYKIKNTADVSDKGLAEIRRKFEGAMNGSEDPKKVRAYLEQKYQESIHQFVWPGAGDVPGRKMIRVVYRTGGRDNQSPMRLYWEFLPSLEGPMVLCMCPECFMQAPAHVDTKSGTQPTIIDGYIARIQGNPEADNKVVPFSLQAPNFTISMHTVTDNNGKPRDLLTIKEQIRCPNHYRCGFIVKCEDSIVTKTSRVFRRGAEPGKRQAGPLIIVK